MVNSAIEDHGRRSGARTHPCLDSLLLVTTAGLPLAQQDTTDSDNQGRYQRDPTSAEAQSWLVFCSEFQTESPSDWHYNNPCFPQRHPRHNSPTNALLKPGIKEQQ